MDALWPWLAVAAAGALHGLNPLSGWAFAAASGMRGAHDPRRLWQAVWPLMAGHGASVMALAACVAQGLRTPGMVLQIAAGLLLGVVLLAHLMPHAGHPTQRRRAHTMRSGLALWSFMVSTAHGAGLMLVPALVPLCLGNAPGRVLTASGSLTTGLAVVALHAAAMLTSMWLAARTTCQLTRQAQLTSRNRPGLLAHRPTSPHAGPCPTPLAPVLATRPRSSRPPLQP